MSAQRIRGSLFDSVTLTEYPFFFEPKLKDKNSTVYGKQHPVGHRLPNYVWVGNGESHVELDVYLMTFNRPALSMLQGFKDLQLPQDDLGMPHPLYINVGKLYTGKKFVLVDVESEVETFEFDDQMEPREVKVRLKLEQLPENGRVSGTGAR